ncbi:MAG: hypothetical protein ACM3O3_11615 [Syntrophothermus sp.]
MINYDILIDAFNRVDYYLCVMNDENFDLAIAEIDKLAEKIKKLKMSIKANYPDLFAEILPEIERRTKQIRECFDNTINEKKSESNKILIQLSRFRSEKNAMKYRKNL